MYFSQTPVSNNIDGGKIMEFMWYTEVAYFQSFVYQLYSLMIEFYF